MTHFRKMRLIPDFLYEKLHQDQEPRPVDFGDTDNSPYLSVGLSDRIVELLSDSSRPIEDRVRIANQHLLRQLLRNPDATEEETRGEEKKRKDLLTDRLATLVKKRKESEIPEKKTFDNVATTAITPHPALNKRVESETPSKKAFYNVATTEKEITHHPAVVNKRKESEIPLAKTLDNVVTTTEKEITPHPALNKRKEFEIPLAKTFDKAATMHEEITPHPVQQQKQAELNLETVESSDDDEQYVTAADWSTEPVNKSISPAAAAAPATATPPDRPTLRRALVDAFSEFMDDSTFMDQKSSRVKGFELEKILNFLVPLKNIHPSKKPAGFAAAVEVLREKDLFDAKLFPNSSLEDLFAEYGRKPTAYRSIVKEIADRNRQAGLIQKTLDDGSKNWKPLS